MFIGHYFDGGSWSDENIIGIKRFINKMKTWLSKTGDDVIDIDSFKKTIFDFTDAFKFNKVISSFMILLNQNKNKSLSVECKEELIKLLEIYAPSIREKIK
jgi:leucyl-tRNA synthetase